MTSSMIEVRGLSYAYLTEQGKSRVLEDIDMLVARGEVCAVIGPSGCGKSTLLKIVAGILGGYEGCVTIDGEPVRPAVQRIGFMPQNYGLLPWKTVRENIELGLRIRRGKIEAGKVKHLMQRLGIAELGGRYPHELSGGQQQRVGLARAFLLQPDVLLMDEPFSALDAITREEMQEVFLSLWQEQHLTTILVTHYVEEALYLGQKILILSSRPGRIAETIDNPLFGRADSREEAEFFRMGGHLRQSIKKDWGKA